jgi:hypothetical protein
MVASSIERVAAGGGTLATKMTLRRMRAALATIDRVHTLSGSRQCEA